VLRDAELEGANMQMSRLHGADLRGSKMQGADLAGAAIWRTLPPGGESSAFSDMSQIALQPPSAEELATLTAALAQLESSPVKTRLSEGLAPLLDAAQNTQWASSADQQLWLGFARASEAAMAEGYRARLTDYLSRLMCRSRFASGAVATGVARRAMTQGFKGDMPALYDKLKASDCPAAASMSPRIMRDLGAAADAARGQ
jgi:hypothetical protein